MSQSRHSAGPWTVERFGNYFEIQAIIPMYERAVVVANTLNTEYMLSEEDNRANAQLMAAAPEMLDALCLAINAMEFIDCPDARHAVECVRAAITKAEEP